MDEADSYPAEADTRKRALLLVHRIPYPPDKGDKIRSWRLVRFLAERYRLSCGFFVDDEADWRHVSYLEGYLGALGGEVKAFKLEPGRARRRSLKGLATFSALTFGYYLDRQMSEWVARQLVGADIAFGFSSSMMPYLLGAGIPVIADLVDADSAKWRQYAETARWPMSWVYAREGRLLASAEAWISREATHTFLISPEEAQVVRDHPRADDDRIDWYTNGVDTTYFDLMADYEPLDWSPDLIFTGAMDYEANVEAVTWFVENCWPALLQKRRDLTFAIVGARPTEAVQQLGEKPGITVTGRVEDMRPWLAASRVAIAPLRVARGVQNKVLEAMAMGRPVIASPEAATGIVANPNWHLLVAEDAQGFINLTGRLLDNPQARSELGTRARAHLVTHYGWDECFGRLKACLDRENL